uniref:Uncharacterized protein n=1 Tax=Anguilla anguilla TaxID=7936 RepID=A0A0E9PTH7_ANGAN
MKLDCGCFCCFIAVIFNNFSRYYRIFGSIDCICKWEA